MHRTLPAAIDSSKALRRHIRDSPGNDASFDRATCNRSFGSEESLSQHLRNSPFRAPSFESETCDRAFGSEEAVEQNVRNSFVHDVFFSNVCLFLHCASLAGRRHKLRSVRGDI